MPTTEELLRTFEGLAVSQRAQADRIEALITAGDLPDPSSAGDLQATVRYLREKAAECDGYAEALRDGDAVSTDDIASGGIEGPFVDNEGREL